VHLSELRDAVNQARARAGLAPASWTDGQVVGVLIKAVHITELRDQLDEARIALGLGVATYTDPGLGVGYTVKAAHVQELRARINEALTAGAGAGIDLRWLVTDQLGTPRIIIDKTGALANVKRHDYLPFGEELSVGQGLRTTALGYTGDNVRQKFTSKERDIETGLDFFKARYYACTQGRFTSSDPMLIAEQKLFDPQQWNMYSYARNNPVVLTDPTGKYVCSDGKRCEQFEKARQEALKSKDADTARGAKAYGDLSTKKGDRGDNGVYVSFADNLKGDRAGSVSRRDTGIELDSNSPNGLRATLNVTIKSDQAGNEEVVAHEGSHVADYQDFVNAIGSDGMLTRGQTR
jgi:RHS repeat-associated protein